nr:nucleolar protein dao-5-like [Aegilops tauschii subsp. strangulata]
MARGDHQDDDDDFMELPQQNRATGQTKDGDEKKKHYRNRASQERLTIMTEGFTDDQKGVAAEMGMQALMDVRCKNLVNPAKLKDVKNMNCCKFIADFLHDAFSNKMYQKGCRLHLMLMYVDRLDLSTIDFTGIGGPPPPHKFAVSAWTYNAVKAVLATDKMTDKKYGKLHARAPVEHLIGKFASGMTGLLRKLVEVWTSLNGSDSDAVARQFTPFVAERTHRPTGCRGRYDYNNSQELPDTQDELDGDAALDKDDDNDMENVQHDTDDDELVEVCAGGKKGKAAPDVPHRRKVKKITTRVTKQNPRDPLERIHSKLSIGGNSDSHEARVDKTAAAPSTIPTSSDASGQPSPPVADVQATTTGIRTSGSDESVSARTAEILPTLLAMKDAAVSHATRSASVEVDAPEINLSKEDSRSSDTDSKRVAKATVSRDGLPPRRCSPRKQSADIPNAPVVARSSRDDSGYVPVSTLFPPPAKSNVMEKMEDRSTTDPGGKSGTTDGGERPKQTASLPAVENSNLNLRTSKLPVNIGVPYSPNKKIGKKVATDTADHTPRPTNKPDDSAADEAEMFVDLSPPDSAPQVVRGPASRQERHPMAFTPPTFSLGI